MTSETLKGRYKIRWTEGGMTSETTIWAGHIDERVAEVQARGGHSFRIKRWTGGITSGTQGKPVAMNLEKDLENGWLEIGGDGHVKSDRERAMERISTRPAQKQPAKRSGLPRHGLQGGKTPRGRPIA